MDVDDLIRRLCVTAGMIMEDASVGAITVGPNQFERIAALLRASEAVDALAHAASKLQGYSDEGR